MSSPEFARFGKIFQERFCQLILDDREFCDQIMEVLDISFLELKYLQVFVDKIFDYRKRYQTHPSRDTMMMMLRTELDNENEVTQKQIRDYFATLSKECPECEYIKDIALNFCKKQKLKEAMIKSVDMIEGSSDIPFDEVSKILNDSLKLGTSNDIGFDYLKDFEARYEMKARDPISTGWEELDKVTMGGIGVSELWIALGSTGSGKSMVCVSIGAHALASGYNVVYYTLELSSEVIGLRFDSALTGFKLNELRQYQEEIRETVEKVPGNLIIKEYPARMTSLQTIQHHLERVIAKGTKPDLVIIDYGDLLRASSYNKEVRHSLQEVFEGMRGLATMFKTRILTCSQVNRSGSNVSLTTMENISESYAKCFCADLIFTISRTIEDRNQNKGRLFLAKNRSGVDSLIYPMYIDTSNVNIQVLPLDGETKQSFDTRSLKETQEYLRDKYKNFKEKIGAA